MKLLKQLGLRESRRLDPPGRAIEGRHGVDHDENRGLDT